MEVNDLSSGLFNTSLGLGQVMGPMFGALMTKNFGFRVCCDTVSLLCLIFAILYYLIADGLDAFKSSRWR